MVLCHRCEQQCQSLPVKGGLVEVLRLPPGSSSELSYHTRPILIIGKYLQFIQRGPGRMDYETLPPICPVTIFSCVTDLK